MDANLNDQLPDRIAAALSALDRDAAKRAEAVDAGRVAERVLQRLKDEPVRVLHPPRVSVRALRVAAAVALLVIGGVVTERIVFHGRGPSMQALRVLPPVTASGGAPVDASQQDAMLDAVEDARAAASDSVVPASDVTIADLNVQELQALLTSLDDNGGTE